MQEELGIRNRGLGLMRRDKSDRLTGLNHKEHKVFTKNTRIFLSKDTLLNFDFLLLTF